MAVGLKTIHDTSLDGDERVSLEWTDKLGVWT